MPLFFVDDTLDILSLYGHIAGDVPHRRSHCPRKALEQLRLSPARVIVTDFEMPGMNGGEFLAAARRICPDAHTIMITGTPPTNLPADQQPHEMITKPFDALALRAKLHAYMAVA